MKHIDWENVEEAKNFEKLPAGGYICGITSVEDVPDKEYIRCEFDIADGDYKNYYRDLFEKKEFWAASFIKSYKPSAQPFFKKFIRAVEKSNKGYKFNDDETTLKRKLVGLVLAYEDYTGADGRMKERIKVTDFVTVDDIKAGNYKVPEENITAKDYNNTPSVDVSFDDDLPF